MAEVTKTSKQGNRRRDPVPITCHSWGIKKQMWAASWLRLRIKHKRNATKDGSLMPACGPDWVLQPGTKMTSDTLTTTLREILVAKGIPPEEASTYTTHSMKTTLLSWTGKCGLPKGIRRSLGGHSKPGDRMPNLYSRNELAEPLRQLGHVLVWVAARIFQPDVTKSGIWSKHPRDALRELPKGANAISTLKARVVGNADPTVIYATEIAGACSAKHPLGDIPLLGDSTLDVDLPESDVSDAEDENERRDQLEHRAAEVALDHAVARADQPADAAAPPAEVKYAPLHFKVLRHIFKGTRHWSEDGKTIICPGGQHRFKPENYSLCTTHGDHLCDGCVSMAGTRFSVPDAREYAHGKQM